MAAPTRYCNWMFNAIQNENLQMFAHAIQRNIITEAKASNYFGLNANEQRKQAIGCSFLVVYNLLMITWLNKMYLLDSTVHQIQSHSYYFHVSRMVSPT